MSTSPNSSRLYLYTGISFLVAVLALLPVRAFAPPSPQSESGQANASQEPVEAGKIKVEAPSVVVDVIVTDKKDRSASELAASDFAVSDNDVPQKIVTFVPPLASGGAPVSTPTAVPEKASTPPPPNSLGSRQPSVEREARNLASVHFITLVMDMGDLQPGNIPRATRAAAEYIQKVIAPDDFVAVYWLDQSLHLALPFTQDKPKAVEAIQKLGSRVPAGRMSALMRIETEQEINDLEANRFGFMAGAGPGAGEPGTTDIAAAGALERELATLRAFLWSQSTLQARAVFVALRAIAQAYRELPGRKNVIVFSEGFTHAPEAGPAMQAVIESANRANVAFYIIDAAGLTANFGAASHGMDASVAAKISEMGAEPAPDIMAEGFDQFQFIQQVGTDIQHDDLGQVAAATGGFYIKNQNDLLRGLKLADRDLREFYTLVYQPTGTKYDGSFHRIKVKLLKPGYHVRYRLGYWAVPPSEELMVTPAAAQLLGALASGSLRPAFKPELNAALLLAPDGKLAMPVRVALPARSVGFVKDKNSYRAGFTLVLAGFDRLNHLVSVHQRFVTLNLDQKQWKEFERKTLDVNARLAVPRLEPLEVEAIFQFADGTVALARREIAVGKTSASGLRLTSLLLSDDVQPASGPADPSDPLRGPNFELHIPMQPQFSPADKLTVYFGVLEDSLAPASALPRVRLTYAIKSGGTVVESLPPEEVGGAPSGTQMLVFKQLDLRNLHSGTYTLEVKAEDLDHRGTASEVAEFTVS